jgi:hypothetical protein
MAEIPEDDLPRMAKSRKMTYREWPNPGRYLTEDGQIPEEDLPRFAKSRLKTSRNWPGPETSITVIWARICKRLRSLGIKILRSRYLGSLNVYEFWHCCHRQVNLLNFNRGFDETSSLKSSSVDIRFRLVASRNFKEFWNRLSRILKVCRQFFEPTFTLGRVILLTKSYGTAQSK